MRTIVSSDGEWGEHQQLVDGLRKALHRDYPDVLADEIKPNPPVRGDKCEARIYLKERASLWVCVVTRAQEKTQGERSSGLPESAPGALPGYPLPNPAVNEDEDANLVAPERPVG